MEFNQVLFNAPARDVTSEQFELGWIYSRTEMCNNCAPTNLFITD